MSPTVAITDVPTTLTPTSYPTIKFCGCFTLTCDDYASFSGQYESQSLSTFLKQNEPDVKLEYISSVVGSRWLLSHPRENVQFSTAGDSLDSFRFDEWIIIDKIRDANFSN